MYSIPSQPLFKISCILSTDRSLQAQNGHCLGIAGLSDHMCMHDVYVHVHCRYHVSMFCTCTYTSSISFFLSLSSIAVCIGMIWDSDQPDVDDIMNVVESIGTILRVSDVRQ